MAAVEAGDTLIDPRRPALFARFQPHLQQPGFQVGAYAGLHQSSKQFQGCFACIELYTRHAPRYGKRRAAACAARRRCARGGVLTLKLALALRHRRVRSRLVTGRTPHMPGAGAGLGVGAAKAAALAHAARRRALERWRAAPLPAPRAEMQGPSATCIYQV